MLPEKYRDLLVELDRLMFVFRKNGLLANARLSLGCQPTPLLDDRPAQATNNMLVISYLGGEKLLITAMFYSLLSAEHIGGFGVSR